GEGLLDSEQGDLYQDMLDQQWAAELTRGRGLGLADMLIRQLSGVGVPAAVAGGASTAASGEWPPRSREGFVATLWPHAVAAGRELGVDPATIVSHAALETGWGRS